MKTIRLIFSVVLVSLAAPTLATGGLGSNQGEEGKQGSNGGFGIGRLGLANALECDGGEPNSSCDIEVIRSPGQGQVDETDKIGNDSGEQEDQDFLDLLKRCTALFGTAFVLMEFSDK